ncbi:MAG TPA: hypothetical protein VFY25_10840 [Anaerolineales bacterium]|nr:hypothetical protein [Anaerolineales bacterium]
MKPHLFYSILTVSILLFAVYGCGRAAPTPVVHPTGVQTSLTRTASASAKQTQDANRSTVTPSPTATQTLTPTPRISLNGTSLEEMEDQATLFTDHKLGYQLTLPSGWLPVRINEDEYYKAFTLEAVSENPTFVKFLTILQNQDSDYVRVAALDIRPEQAEKGFVSGITVVLQPETTITVDEWAKIGSTHAGAKGYQLLKLQFEETVAGIRMLVREESWDSPKEAKVYRKRVFFSLPSGVLTIDFETGLDAKETLLPEFDQAINSFEMLDKP